MLSLGMLTVFSWAARARAGELGEPEGGGDRKGKAAKKGKEREERKRKRGEAEAAAEQRRKRNKLVEVRWPPAMSAWQYFHSSVPCCMCSDS